MPSIGAPEIVIILVLALLVFGPKRLPEMGRSLGRTVREFKKASDTARKEFGVDEIERELKDVKSEVAGVGRTLSDVKADVKIDIDAEAARPGVTAGAAAGAGSAAAGAFRADDAAADTAVTDPADDVASSAEVTGDDVLSGEVVDDEILSGEVVDDAGDASAGGPARPADAVRDV